MGAREVFRIESRTHQEGAFWSCAIGLDWKVFRSMPTPYVESETLISQFLDQYGGIFAFLSLRDIRDMFTPLELGELDSAGFHITVFLVPNEAGISAFSLMQVIFDRDQVQWVRFISLIDM